jgi:hypothetical protein
MRVLEKDVTGFQESRGLFAGLWLHTESVAVVSADASSSRDRIGLDYDPRCQPSQACAGQAGTMKEYTDLSLATNLLASR